MTFILMNGKANAFNININAISIWLLSVYIFHCVAIPFHNNLQINVSFTYFCYLVDILHE